MGYLYKADYSDEYWQDFFASDEFHDFLVGLEEWKDRVDPDLDLESYFERLGITTVNLQAPLRYTMLGIDSRRKANAMLAIAPVPSVLQESDVSETTVATTPLEESELLDEECTNLCRQGSQPAEI